MAHSKVRNALLAGAAVVAAGTGVWALQREPAPGGVVIQTPTPAVTATVTPPAATPTAARILVHVAGAVREPGVYALLPDDRVLDAVEAAGGLTEDADVDQVNLADHLQDAMRLHIPAQGETALTAPTPIPAVRSSGVIGVQAGGLVNINSASQAELETLPHIGEALAGRIIAYRQANGPFARSEDIMKVAGIGDKTFADLRDLITAQ
jgi:competence protein ComEA